MQFQKRTKSGSLGVFAKLIVKFVLVILVLFICVLLLDRIDFPSPNKKIEKVLPNENFKTIK
jgi:large-conductance mechanosensitive channel